MASHYTLRSLTTLHDFGGDLGHPLDTFFWALTISWSQLLACVRVGPNCVFLILQEVGVERKIIRISYF